MNALQDETVPQVRRLLLQALAARQEPGSGSPESATSAPSGSSDRASGLGTFDVAALIRHELAPAVGWIRLAADGDIEIFANSKTDAAIRKLQRRIDGLVALIKAGVDLNLRRFSLPHILAENWPGADGEISISPDAGVAAIDIETDEGLFSMLLSNVYQNAIDASIGATGKATVDVSWGHTEASYWVRVTNAFTGNKFSLSDVIDVGNSTKPAHQGQGLTLISMVADRLNVSVSLEGASGVASFTLAGRRPHV